jgi:hypothetical protein
MRIEVSNAAVLSHLNSFHFSTPHPSSNPIQQIYPIFLPRSVIVTEGPHTFRPTINLISQIDPILPSTHHIQQTNPIILFNARPITFHRSTQSIQLPTNHIPQINTINPVSYQPITYHKSTQSIQF